MNPFTEESLINQSDEDPIEKEDFDVISYINELFPTEDSLNQLDNVIKNVEKRIQQVDKKICRSVCQDKTFNWEGTKGNIRELLQRIEQIKSNRELRGDMRQWDVGKANLSSSISTLTHVHMLMRGIDSLGVFAESRQYGDASHMLKALFVLEQKFLSFKSLHVKSLLNNLNHARGNLTERICCDLRSVIEGTCSVPLPLLAEASDTLHVLGWDHVEGLLAQICEYYENGYINRFDVEDCWVDRVNVRIKYIKKTLAEFEGKFAAVFPLEWEVSERIAIRLCQATRDGLSHQLSLRDPDHEEIVFAVEKLTEFEDLLAKRLSGETLHGDETFNGIISQCLRRFSKVYEAYLENLIKNMTESGDDSTFGDTQVLSSATQLFTCLGDAVDKCVSLAIGRSFFERCLSDYSENVLHILLPHVSNDQKNPFFLSARRLSQTDIKNACVVVSTCGFCMESSNQLMSRLGINVEETPFRSAMENAVKALCDDLVGLCRPHLKTMSKSSWHSVVSTGTEGGYVSSINEVVATWVPPVRAHFSHNMRYFIHICRQLVNLFVGEYNDCLTKCRQVVPLAAEQLHLDTYSIKMCLQQIPMVGSSQMRPPPSSYVNLVTEKMSWAELILKVIMSSGTDDPSDFVHSYLQHSDSPNVTELEKLLEMKGVKKSDVGGYVECFVSEIGRFA